MDIIGSGENIKLKQAIQKAAVAGANVLICLDSGSDGESIARNIHAQSMRKHEPFISIDCATLVADQVVSEDFVRLLKSANNGIIYLKDVAQVPEALQAQFLQVLQVVPTNVRIIAATDDDLDARILAGQFCQALYDHLNGFIIQTSGALDTPNDIRGLDEVVMIKADLANGNFDLKQHLENIEIGLIYAALQRSRGVVALAARILGIRRTTLIEKMKKYHIVKDAMART